MPNPTWNQVADDVLLAMGYTTDDSLRHRPAVIFNATLIYNKLLMQELRRDEQSNDAIGSSSLLFTYIVDVTHRDVEDNISTEFDASFFDLPTPIMNLENNSGLNMVRYLRNDIPAGCPPAIARTPFSITTLPQVYSLYQSAYQAPQSDRPYVAQVQDRVYLFGVPTSVKKLLVAIFPAADNMDIDVDAPINLPPHLFHTLKKMLLDMEGYLLQIPQERLQNDGADFQPGQTVNVRPLVSLNDQNQSDA